MRSHRDGRSVGSWISQYDSAPLIYLRFDNTCSGTQTTLVIYVAQNSPVNAATFMHRREMCTFRLVGHECRSALSIVVPWTLHCYCWQGWWYKTHAMTLPCTQDHADTHSAFQRYIFQRAIVLFSIDVTMTQLGKQDAGRLWRHPRSMIIVICLHWMIQRVSNYGRQSPMQRIFLSS